jgi:hypothetical protein
MVGHGRAPFGHPHIKRPFGHLLAGMFLDGNRAAPDLVFLLSPLPSSPIYLTKKIARTSTVLTPTCDCGNVYDEILL